MRISTWPLLALAFLAGGFWGARPLAAQQAGGGGASKANLDLPFDAVGEKEEEEEAPEIIVFYGQQYEGDGIFFCVDTSGSMNQNGRFQKVKRDCIKNIQQFSERVQFGICFFNGQQTLFPASGRPADANPAMKAAAIGMVASAQTGNGSCYKEALMKTLLMATQATAKRRIIICMGDGEVNCNGSTDATLTLSQVKARNVSGVKINAICFASNVGEPFMRNLAAQNNGTYARVD
jgi:Mg-chelatase subunit ChlD